MARPFPAPLGPVPGLPGISRNATFDAVEAVESPAEPRTVEPSLVGGVAQADEDDMLTRYLAARLSSRSVFGEGYYGCGVFPGLTSLWLSVAVAGWLARYHAALDSRGSVSPDDLANALGIVDRAATRLPALGTAAERARRVYLSNNDGVARLLWHYAPLSRPKCP